jgi:hypothetical protein
MSDNSDDAMTDLFRAMIALIEAHKLNLSPAELEQCHSFVATTQELCAEATAHCNRMGYSDARARDYLRGVLAGIIERTQQIPMTFTMGGSLH